MYSKFAAAIMVVISFCFIIGQNNALHLNNAYLLPVADNNLFVPRFSEVKRFRSEPIRFGKRGIAAFREPVRFGKRSWPSTTYDQEVVASNE